MKYIESVTLFGLSRLKGERTSSSIYHILRGKKTSQTIQDSHLYELEFLFHILPKIKRFIIEDAVNTLFKMKLIVESGTDQYIITQKGKDCVEHFIKNKGFPPHLNGWEYEMHAEHFWPRLSLVVQTISYLLQDKKNFIPITDQDSILLWVKNFFREISLSREELATQLKLELSMCLKQLPQPDADMLILRLSSIHRAGLTNVQIAEEFGMDIFESEVWFKGVLHHVIKCIHSENLTLLSKFMIETNELTQLTTSTARTYELLMQGKLVDTIASERNLKQSTIEDHLVELALHINNFQIDPYVDKKEQERIRSVIENTNTRRLKFIKSELNEQISYFKIRLVLAKDGNKNES